MSLHRIGESLHTYCSIAALPDCRTLDYDQLVMKQFTIWWLLVACSISTVVRSQAVSASPQQLQHRQATPNEQQQPLHQETAGARSLSFTTGWAQDSWRSFPDASAQVRGARGNSRLCSMPCMHHACNVGACAHHPAVMPQCAAASDITKA